MISRFRAGVDPWSSESYGASYAWLKPDTSIDPEPDDALWWPTQAGRELTARWRAECALFCAEITSLK